MLLHAHIIHKNIGFRFVALLQMGDGGINETSDLAYRFIIY
jgi:hypothetical protein